MFPLLDSSVERGRKYGEEGSVSGNDMLRISLLDTRTFLNHQTHLDFSLDKNLMI